MAVRNRVDDRPERPEDVPSYFDQTPPPQSSSFEWTWPQRPVAEARPPTVSPQLLQWTRYESVTFVRAIDTGFEAAATGLQRWWQEESHGGVLDVGRGRLMGDPNRMRGRCCMEVHLGRWFGLRMLAMELELVPWHPSY